MSQLITKRLNLTFYRCFNSNKSKIILKRPFSIQNKLVIGDQCEFSSSKQKIKRSSQFPLTRHFSSDITEESADDASEEPIFTEFDEICEKIEKFRETLYPNDVKEVVELNGVGDLKEFFEFLRNKEKFDNKITFCQTFIVLWDLMRHEIMANLAKPSELQRIHHTIFSHPELRSVLDTLKKYLDDDSLSFDEMSCIMMYLNKLGFSIKDPLIQQIINNFLDKIEKLDSNSSVPLSALSRYTVAIFTEVGLYPYYACIDVLPHIYRHLKECNDSESIRLITICMNHILKIITDDVMTMYKNKLRELMANGILNERTIKTNLKILLFLNYPEWAIHNSQLTRDLHLLMENDIENFQVKELFLVQKNIKNRLEPWNMIPKLVKRSDELMKTSPCPELLACSLIETVPEKRRNLSKVAQDLVETLDPASETAVPSLFKALRLLKTSNMALCDKYWDKVVTDIRSESNTIFNTVRHIHRYMHFNNNLAGTYRHREFERVITEFLLRELTYGLSAFMPSAFARAVSFIVAYSNNLVRDEMMPDFILDKIESMSGQFSIYDCLRMSKGIQIAHELRYRYFIPAREAPYLLKLEEILNNCAERHINQANLNIDDVNLILKAFNARKCSRKSNLFQKIIGKYDAIQDFCLSSRTIRDITFNLVMSSYQSPQLFEKFVHYIIQNKHYVGGETLEKTLTCFYNLGYIPGNEEFYELSNKIIARDFNFMSGLSIIQSCLALTFFKGLKKDLIHQVFNINFIKRLEEEIEGCYAKETYPERVLNNVMQLNRAVCLDIPEANVPWFQQNYIEAQMSKSPNIETKFKTDVRKTLLEIVPNQSWIKQNHVTPYGYKIEFVLYLNEKKEFIPPPEDDRSILGKITKIAVIPLRVEAYCENPPYTDLKGFEALKKYHLEILGYKVIQVNFRDWNSMYLNLPGARQDHLGPKI
uniref:CSON011909 protein n=1 Tax=Culicoides sonorensis TaxID=179676 RepID=A0A336KMZ3_CULSO